MTTATVRAIAMEAYIYDLPMWITCGCNTPTLLVHDLLTVFSEINTKHLLINQILKGQPGHFTDGLEGPLDGSLSKGE